MTFNFPDGYPWIDFYWFDYENGLTTTKISNYQDLDGNIIPIDLYKVRL